MIRLCARLLLLGAAALTACCGDEPPPLTDPTYESLETIVRRSCARSMPCHGVGGRADLDFVTPLDEGRLLTEVLIDVPACQYDLMDRVEPGSPDESWLMIKLTSAHDADGEIAFTPDPAWVPMLEPRPDGTYPLSMCPFTRGGRISFGDLMPLVPRDPHPLPENEITLLREWITLGAPGPI